MPPAHGDGGVLHPAQIHRFLWACDGRCRPERDGEHDVHAVGDAAVDAAGAVGLRIDRRAVRIERIVGLAAPQRRKALSIAEADGLHGGDGKDMAADLRLHRVPPVGAAQSGGDTGNGTADTAAHAVTGLPGFGGTLPQGFLVQDPGAYRDALRLQVCLCQTARHGQRRGQPSGEPPAAPIVVVSAGADKGGVVGVAGAGGVLQGRIVTGADVAVAQHRHQRVAGGLSLEHAGEELHLIRFMPSGGQVAGGSAPQEIRLYQIIIHRQSRRHILQENAYGGAVGLSEQCVFHHGSSTSVLPPRAAISFQKLG